MRQLALGENPPADDEEQQQSLLQGPQPLVRRQLDGNLDFYLKRQLLRRMREIREFGVFFPQLKTVMVF